MASDVTLESVQGQLAAASAAVYTCPANTYAKIHAVSVCNDTTTVPTFTFYIVKAGGAAGAATYVINDRPLASKGTDLCRELRGHNLEAGDAIHGVASSADQVTYHISVLEVVKIR